MFYLIIFGISGMTIPFIKQKVKKSMEINVSTIRHHSIPKHCSPVAPLVSLIQYFETLHDTSSVFSQFQLKHD